MIESQPQSKDGIRAKEDFCKGCGNFDAFYNGCKLTTYWQSIGGKKERITPTNNQSRWLLAVVGCISDTRTNPATTSAEQVLELLERIRQASEIMSNEDSWAKRGDLYENIERFLKELQQRSGKCVIKDACNSCHYETQACVYILNGRKYQDACLEKKIELRQRGREQG
jgi:hypothetical protein